MQKRNMSQLDIIIVNWNAGIQLKDCLMSIGLCDKAGFELSQVIVVDNDSVDGSLNGLDNIHLPLIFARNCDNLGFGTACNQGAQISKADYLLFLNPDIRLKSDSLMIPMAYMEAPEKKNVAVCGIKLVDELLDVSKTCARLPRPEHFFSKIFGLDVLFPKAFKSHIMAEWDHNDTRPVDHVIGAFYLVRKSVYNQLRGFDTRFFVYFEDLDFSNRVKRHGYEIHYIADAEAFHKGGGTSQRIKAKRLFYSLRSRIQYGFKNFGGFSAILHFAATLFMEPITRLVLAAMHRSFKETRETVEGYLMLYKDIPDMMRRMR